MEFSHLLPRARAEAAPFFNHVAPGEMNPTAVALRDIFSVRACLFRTSVFSLQTEPSLLQLLGMAV